MVVILVALTFVICLIIEKLTHHKTETPKSFWIQSNQAFEKTLGEEQRIEGYRIRTNLHFHPGHMWVKAEGATRARIGIDDFLAQNLSPILSLASPALATQIKQGAPCLTVQAQPVNQQILAPIGGTIIAINEACLTSPQRILNDPYTAWLLIVENEHLTTECNNLIYGEWVFAWFKQEQARLRVQKRMAAPR